MTAQGCRAAARAPHGMEELLDAVDRMSARDPKDGQAGVDISRAPSTSVQTTPLMARERATTASTAEEQDAAECLASLRPCMEEKSAVEEENAANILCGMSNSNGSRALFDFKNSSFQQCRDMISATINLFCMHILPPLDNDSRVDDSSEYGEGESEEGIGDIIICHGNRYHDGAGLSEGNAIWMLTGRDDPSKVARPDDPPPTSDDHEGESECPRCRVLVERCKPGRKGALRKRVGRRREREGTVPLGTDTEEKAPRLHPHLSPSLTPCQPTPYRKAQAQPHPYLTQFTSRTPPKTPSPTLATAAPSAAPHLPTRRSSPRPLKAKPQRHAGSGTGNTHLGSHTTIWSWTQYQKDVVGVPEDRHNTKGFGNWIPGFVRSGFKPTMVEGTTAGGGDKGKEGKAKVKGLEKAGRAQGKGKSTNVVDLTRRASEGSGRAGVGFLSPGSGLTTATPMMGAIKNPSGASPSVVAGDNTITTNPSTSTSLAPMSDALPHPPPPTTNKKRKASTSAPTATTASPTPTPSGQPTKKRKASSPTTTTSTTSAKPATSPVPRRESQCSVAQSPTPAVMETRTTRSKRVVKPSSKLREMQASSEGLK